MSSDEGFICPLCLVQFGSSSKLSGHFIEMHSDSYPSQMQQESSEFLEEASNSGGHKFKAVHHSKPSNCDKCSEIIWQDSIVCEYCGVTLHSDQCGEEYTLPCTGGEDTSCDMPDDDEQDVRETGPAQQPRGILPYVRRKVAKDRQRYVNDEFDLDLTYITERIIAMSFPATGMATAYRNNLKDVAKMLQTKHEDNYMIFNLSERSYDITNFNNQVLDFGWPDHLAPSLERLSSVCKSMKSWLDSEPQHVAVVHCKGGKGRTGCVIAAFMHYSEICHSAEAALDRFAMKRFYDSKCGGVTQPSQRKYVHYFADLLAGKIDLQAPAVTLQHVIMHGIPNFDGKGGCKPFLKVYENMTLVHTSGMYLCHADKERVKISIYGGLSLKGEVLIKCFHKKTHGMDPVFRCQFHSAVVRGDLRMVFNKTELDDAFKDKRFDDGIKVELIFDNADDQYPDDLPFADVRGSLLDGKTPPNGSTNGNVGLDDDVMLKRNSYASFRGGYDSGMPGDEPANLIDLESPKITVSRVGNRSRSSSALSFQMDPESIERVPHPQTAEIYTVVSKPGKEKPSRTEDKPMKLERPKPGNKPSKSSSDLTNDSLFSFLDKSDRRMRDSSPSRARAKPPSRPLPPSPKKLQVRPLPDLPYGSANQNFDEDYAEIDDESTMKLSAADGASEGQFVHAKPTKSSPDHAPKVIKPRPFRPPPPSKPKGKPQTEGKSPGKESAVKEELEKKLLKQHLQKKRESAMLQPGNKQKSVDSAVIREKPKPVMRHIPSYDEIPLDNQIKVQHLPARASAVDNDMWAAVKFPHKKSKPPKDSMKRRSNSDDNLTLTSNSGSDFYSNLEDLDITQGVESPGIQRSRSFSNHADSRMVIKGTVNANRDSIIPVTSPIDEPEYKNLEYAPDGTLIESPPPHSEATPTGLTPPDSDALPPDVLRARKEILREVIRTHNYENTGVEKPAGGAAVFDGRTEDDYINELPEGIFHIYSNQDELLDQLRTAHQPVDESLPTPSEEVTTPSAPTPQRTRIGSAASILKVLLELLNIRKPKPQSIHSQKVSDEERHKTLAPFEISGIEIGRVNRDYEAFLRTSAWGSTEPESAVPDPNSSDTRRTPPPKPDRPKNLAPPDSPIQPRKYRRPVKQNSKESALFSPPETPPLTAPIPVPGKRHPPLAKKPSGPLLDAPRSNEEKHRVLPDQPVSHDERHRPLPEQPRSHDDKPRPHPRLQATNSDAPIVPRPKAVRDLAKGNRHSEVPAVPKSERPKPPPPAKPIPYNPHSDRSAPNEAAVKALMSLWYRPTWTRDQAIEHVRPLDPGSFVVRDSQTVQGGYALTLKLSDDHVRRRKKLAEDKAISEEMTVTHFLVQPDPEGVKLQGWNERPFKSLSEFIAHHTIERLCMPCRLVLPSSSRGSVRRKPGGIVQALQSGAACSLVYLGSMDVSSPGDDSVLAETVQNLRSLESNMNIVTFKASREGVTLSDNVTGMFIRRQYPISSITYCGLDPNDTRWDFPSIQHSGEHLSLKDKPCFGLVYHPQDGYGYSCLVFAEFDSSQPVTSVVNLVQKAMKEHKISNRQK